MSSTDMVRLLLDKSADVNAKEARYGLTALMWTKQFGHTEVVELLKKGRRAIKNKKSAAKGKGDVILSAAKDLL